jgi:hypothetical protein
MIKHNTHWSSPKRNILAGLNDLRKALASGYNAQLIRLANEDCSYPIKVKNSITDFKAYEFSIGLLKTRQQVQADLTMPEFEKYLTLNYKTCYGTQRAVDRYYDTGIITRGNFKGHGRSHLVAVKDLVRFHATQSNKKDKEYAKMFEDQYFGEDTAGEQHFFDIYRLKREHSVYTIKRFKKKLWVVDLIKDGQPKAKIPVLVHVMNVLAYPLKFVPERSTLKMNEYRCVTFRIGDVIHGFSVEFHIPKRFAFYNYKR